MIKGQIDICLFTSSQQVANIFRFAKKLNKNDQLLRSFKNIVIGSVGSNTTLALTSHGIKADYEPEVMRMGNLVREIARRSDYLLLKKRASAKNRVDTNNWKRTDTNWGKISEKKRKAITYNSQFMKACRKEETNYTPIWIMRQAGRFSRHYRAIRSNHTFLELCKSPEIASEVTLMAVDQLGVDAAIIFSPVLTSSPASTWIFSMIPAMRGRTSTSRSGSTVPVATTIRSMRPRSAFAVAPGSKGSGQKQPRRRCAGPLDRRDLADE